MAKLLRIQSVLKLPKLPRENCYSRRNQATCSFRLPKTLPIPNARGEPRRIMSDAARVTLSSTHIVAY